MRDFRPTIHGVVPLHLGLKNRSNHDSTYLATGLLDPPPQLAFVIASISTHAALASVAIVAKDNMGEHCLDKEAIEPSGIKPHPCTRPPLNHQKLHSGAILVVTSHRPCIDLILTDKL